MIFDASQICNELASYEAWLRMEELDRLPLQLTREYTTTTNGTQITRRAWLEFEDEGAAALYKLTYL